MLGRVLDRAASWPDADIDRDWPFYPENGVVFQQLLAPFVVEASAGFDSAPLVAAQRTLLQALATQAAFAFHLELSVFKAARETGLGAWLRRVETPGSDAHHRDFVRSMFDGGFAAFFAEYAVLARQLATITANWSDAMAELLGRIDDDRELLAETFGARGPLQSLRLGLSDRHNGGRTTAICTFASGTRVVYKPKPLDTDAAIADLFAWIDSKKELLAHETFRVLRRDGYGWQELVEHTGCADEDALRRFYTRTGHLLAIVYALEGYDCHHENLIARGEHPHLVDTETLFNPAREAVDDGSANAMLLATRQVVYSVMRTGLLPSWNIKATRGKQDTSGLGGAGVEGNDVLEVRSWTGVNTDDVHVELAERSMRARANAPFVEGEAPAPSDRYVAEIRAGFREMYAFLLRHRHELCAALDHWSNLHVRFVRRATNLYAMQLSATAQPEKLRDGRDFSLAIEPLARLFLAPETGHARDWALFRSETRALIEGDIPFFRVRSDGVDVEDGGGATIAPGYFAVPALERMRRKLSLLCEADLELQSRTIEYAFHARSARSFHDRPAESSGRTDTDASPRVTREECIAVAGEIAGELRAEALRGRDGSMAWIALEYLKESDVFQLKPIAFNLYSGSTGVALFLAALAKVTGEESYARDARAACAATLDLIRTDLDGLARFTGIGGGTGAGSVIYGLATIASLLDDAQLLDAARACAMALDAEAIARDTRYDLMFGAAGAIAGTLKLATVLGRAEAAPYVDVAVRCGEHLLAARGSDGLVPTLRARPVTGISHGAAGIALALLRLFEHTGDIRFRDAARAHMDFEESQYDASLRNYRDYRSTPEQPAKMTNWCHGSPGIALSRIAARHLVEDDAAIARGVGAADAFTLDYLDHLCCGNMGRIEILAEHARRSGDAATRANVERKTRWVLDRYRERGGFTLFVNAPNKVFSPGLFTGSSGIAYALLRIAAPGVLPCVLAYE